MLRAVLSFHIALLEQITVCSKVGTTLRLESKPLSDVKLQAEATAADLQKVKLRLVAGYSYKLGGGVSVLAEGEASTANVQSPSWATKGHIGFKYDL